MSDFDTYERMKRDPQLREMTDQIVAGMTGVSAFQKRKASGDPMKRLTYRHQHLLAMLRRYGVPSDDEHARFIRRQLRTLRGVRLRDR